MYKKINVLSSHPPIIFFLLEFTFLKSIEFIDILYALFKNYLPEIKQALWPKLLLPKFMIILQPPFYS